LPATEGTWRIVSGRDAACRWAGPQVVLATAVLLVVVGLVLISRRAVGALAAPLPPLQLVTTAIVVAAWAWTIRAVWWRWMPIGTGPADRLVQWTPSVGLLLVATACSWPGSRWIDWVVWLPIVASEWCGAKLHAIPARPSALRRTVPGSPAVTDVPRATKSGPPADEEQTLQELTRVRQADGSEMVYGTLAAQFAPGARVVTLHAAFCPPFARLPRVEADVGDGPEAIVKIVQVLTNGVRIDVQLARAAERAECVTVEMSATDGNAL
jgi:hypothetical protein